MAEVTGKVANAVVKVQVQNQDKIGAANATLAKTGGLLSQVGNVAGETSNKAVSAFASIHESIENAGATLTKFMGSLALLGSGAALSGISYIGAAQEKLYEEQLMKSIEANKKWGMSNAESLKKVQDQIAGANKLAYTSSGKMAASIQAAYTYGGKYARGEKGLDIAAEAEKVAFAYKPKPGEAGLVGEELVADIMRKTALRLDQKRKMAIALGVDVDNKQLDTVSGRLKLLEKQAGKIQIDLEMKAQPWKIAQGNLEKLRDQIGNSMIGPMSTLINRFSDLVDTIMKIPGASSFIGWAAIGMAAVGVFSLMITAITSVAGTLKLAAIATKVYAAAQWLLTTAKISLIGANEAEMFSQVRATGAANLGTIARIRQTAVTWAHTAATYAVSIATGAWTAAQWLLNAAMSANPLGIAIIALAGLAALLYLVEQKTHFFSNAWKDISKTAFVQDLIAQFSSLVGWISQGAAGLAKLGGGGALKMVLTMAMGPAMLLLKPVLAIADWLSRIFVQSGTLNKLINVGLGLWKMIADFLGWLSDTVKGMWSWLENAMPGAKKEEARQKMEKLLGKSGFEYAPSVEGTQYIKIPGYAQPIPIKDLAAIGSWGGGNIAYEGGTLGVPAFGSDFFEKYSKRVEAYENAPSAWSEVADAVGNAVANALSDFSGNISSAIADAISGAVFQIPGMDKLAGAIDSLQKFLEEHFGPGVGAPEQLTPETKSNLEDLLKEKGLALSTSKVGGKEFYEYYKLGERRLLSDEELKDLGLEREQAGGVVHEAGLQVGGPITKSGFAFLHRGEEVPTVGAVRGGETTLDKINKLFAGHGGRAGGDTYNNQFDINLNVQKMDSKTDISKAADLLTDEIIDKLNFKNRNRLDNLGMRGVATLRGV